jgi:DNA-binding FadR family transcriptional regulator
VAGTRASTLIIEQVLRLTEAQHLGPGDLLPSERELCTLLGASRSTVREAARVLESRGPVEVRVGANADDTAGLREISAWATALDAGARGTV